MLTLIAKGINMRDFRSSFWRSKCLYEKDYDAVIDLIKQHNPACPQDPKRAEFFATEVVHDCIRRIVFDGVKWTTTGGCLAVLTVQSNEDRKVILAFKPCHI